MTERLAIRDVSADHMPHQHNPTFPSPSDDNEDQDDGSNPAAPPADLFHWSLEVTPKALQVALLLILQCAYNGTLLHVLRAHKGNHIDPPTFRVALRRVLCLPLLDRPQTCACGRTIDISGDHYFGDHPNFSRTALHNHCRNSHYVCLRTLDHLCGVIQGKDDVLLEPGKLAPDYTTAQQGDLAMVTAIPTTRYAAANNTVVATPPVALTPEKQEAATAALHARKEIGKWKGTSHPTGTPTQQAALGTKTVPGHLIVEDMIRNSTVFFPFTINPWMREGPVAQMVKHRRKIERTAYSDHNFGREAGA